MSDWSSDVCSSYLGTLIETRSFGTTSFGTASPELKSLVAAYQPDSAIVASVVDIHPEFIAWLQQHTHLHFFPGELRLPLENTYRNPETLGADRLAAVLGAGSSQVLSQTLQAAQSMSSPGSPPPEPKH